MVSLDSASSRDLVNVDGSFFSPHEVIKGLFLVILGFNLLYKLKNEVVLDIRGVWPL